MRSFGQHCDRFNTKHEVRARQVQHRHRRFFLLVDQQQVARSELPGSCRVHRRRPHLDRAGYAEGATQDPSGAYRHIGAPSAILSTCQRSPFNAGLPEGRPGSHRHEGPLRSLGGQCDERRPGCEPGIGSLLGLARIFGSKPK